MNPTLLAALALVGAVAAPGKPPSPVIADAFATVQRGGKPYSAFYNDFVAPHAVVGNGIVFTAHQDGEGRPVVAAYDTANKTWLGPVRASDHGLGSDTHGNPSICIDRHGHLHVFFGCHSHPMRHVRSTAPHDIRHWEEMSSPFEPATYPQSMRMADGSLYLFCRNARGHLGPWSLKISRDDGRTWSQAEPVIDMRRGLPDRKACSYNAFVPGAGYDTVHCFWVYKDDDPRGNKRRHQGLHEAVYRYNIYYAKRGSDGRWTAADGTPMTDLPVNKTFSDNHARLVDSGEEFAKIVRIVIGPDDTPYLRFSTGVDDWKNKKIISSQRTRFASPVDDHWRIHERKPDNWPDPVGRLLMTPGPAAFGGPQPNPWFIHFKNGPEGDRNRTHVWLGHIDHGYASRNAATPGVRIDGERILSNGREIKLVGLRCSNALISDRTTTDLIEALDLYQSYGLNTVSVFFMGSRFGDVMGYLADGSLDPVYRGRMERILTATAERNMVTIVGCLYWSTSKAREDLSDWTQADACRAVADTARWLGESGFRHVILDPDNEGMATRANNWKVEALIAAAKEANPGLVVANNTRQDPPNEDLNMHFGRKEKGKPWLDSEATPEKLHGGYWGKLSKETHQADKGYYNYSRIGRYTTEMKANQLHRTADEIERFNGHILASTWIQCGPAEGVGGPFTRPGGRSELGSHADKNAAWNRDIDKLHPDAGILWWLEAVREIHPPRTQAP